MLKIAVVTPEGTHHVEVQTNFDLETSIEIRKCDYCDNPFKVVDDDQRFDKKTHRKSFHRKGLDDGDAPRPPSF